MCSVKVFESVTDILKVNKADLLPDPMKGDVKDTLQCDRGVFETERHPCMPVGAEERGKRFLVLVLFRRRYSPVAVAEVQREKDGSVARKVDTTVFPRRWVGTQEHFRVRSAVAYAYSLGVVFFGDEDDKRDP